jgi:hypothetical protein
MKIDNQRVIGEDIIEESQFTQTRIINFIPDEKELNVDIFGLFLKDIPTKKNAILGEPDLIGCLVNFTINRKEETIKFNKLLLGVDIFGENHHSELDKTKICNWLPIIKVGFRKYEINSKKLPIEYPTNLIIDSLKMIVFKSAR